MGFGEGLWKGVLFLISIFLLEAATTLRAQQKLDFSRSDPLEQLLLGLDDPDWKTRYNAVEALIERGPRVKREVRELEEDPKSFWYQSSFAKHKTLEFQAKLELVYSGLSEQEPPSDDYLVSLLKSPSVRSRGDVESLLIQRQRLSSTALGLLLKLAHDSLVAPFALSVLLSHKVPNLLPELLSRYSEAVAISNYEDVRFLVRLMAYYFPRDPRAGPILAICHFYFEPDAQVLSGWFDNSDFPYTTQELKDIEEAKDWYRDLVVKDLINVFIAREPSYDFRFVEPKLVDIVTSQENCDYGRLYQVEANLIALPSLSKSSIDQLLKYTLSEAPYLRIQTAENILVAHKVREVIPIIIKNSERRIPTITTRLLMKNFAPDPQTTKILATDIVSNVAISSDETDRLDFFIAASHLADVESRKTANFVLEKMTHYPCLEFQAELATKIPNYHSPITEDELIDELRTAFGNCAIDNLSQRSLSRAATQKLLDGIDKDTGDNFSPEERVLLNQKNEEALSKIWVKWGASKIGSNFERLPITAMVIFAENHSEVRDVLIQNVLTPAEIGNREIVQFLIRETRVSNKKRVQRARKALNGLLKSGSLSADLALNCPDPYSEEV